MSKKIVVEFIGLPGSGKTTLCKNVQTSIQGKSVLITSYNDLAKSKASNRFVTFKYLKNVLIILTNIVFQANLLIYVLSCKPITKNKLKLYLKQIVNIHNYFKNIKKVTSDIVIVDQGILQLVGSLSVPYNKEGNRLNKLLDNICLQFKIDGLVLIDIPSTITHQRIIERVNSNTRFKDWEKGVSIVRLNQNKQILDKIFHYYSNIEAVKCLRLDGEKSVGINKIKLFEFINTTIQSN